MNNTPAPLKIFIADDSALVRTGVKHILEHLGGIEVVGEAATVQEAIELILTRQPNVVILDMQLAGGSGLEVLPQIKQQPQPPVVIVFALYPLASLKQRCIEAGADFVFDKATEIEPLIKVLQQLKQQFS